VTLLMKARETRSRAIVHQDRKGSCLPARGARSRPVYRLRSGRRPSYDMASVRAERRFFVGSNRLGSTARPGAIMQGEVAAARSGMQAIVLYTQNSGPLKNRHGRALAEEAASQGGPLDQDQENTAPWQGNCVGRRQCGRDQSQLGFGIGQCGFSVGGYRSSHRSAANRGIDVFETVWHLPRALG
jgi:hypothetical protein